MTGRIHDHEPVSDIPFEVPRIAIVNNCNDHIGLAPIRVVQLPMDRGSCLGWFHSGKAMLEQSGPMSVWSGCV